jgi:ABC-type antimicrobial peptide transport system permease subunit
MQPALGKTLFINQQPFLVTGVVEDYPTASHLRFNALVSMITLPSAGQSDWLANGYTTYLLLKKGADVAKVQRKIDQVMRKQLNPVYREQFGKSYEQSLREGNVLNYYLQPLLAVHLHSAGLLDIAPRGNILYVYLFSLVGLFLLLAVFNYINLTTAGGVQRAREVGVRKAMGATKKELNMAISDRIAADYRPGGCTGHDPLPACSAGGQRPTGGLSTARSFFGANLAGSGCRYLAGRDRERHGAGPLLEPIRGGCCT